MNYLPYLWNSLMCEGTFQLHVTLRDATISECQKIRELNVGNDRKSTSIK